MSALSKTALKAAFEALPTPITRTSLETLFDNTVDSYQDTLPQLTEAQIAALTPTLNQLVFNTDRNYIMQYNGTIWVALVAMFIGTTAQINASTPKAGQLFYDTDLDTLSFGDGVTHVGVQTTDACWLTTGNAATDPSVNFVGTTDAQDLVIKTDDTERVRVLSDGKVGINGTPTTFQLEVNGSFGARKVVGDDASAIASGLTTQTNFGENIYGDVLSITDDSATPPKIASAVVAKSTDNGEIFARLSYTQSGVLDLVFDVREDGIILKNGTATYLEMTPTGRLKMNLQTYADDAAADADATLPSGALYKLTGNRAIFQKP